MIQETAQPFSTIAEYNQLIARIHRDRSAAWCAEHALVPFPENFLFTVVMPVFNEAETITAMIQRVCAVELPMELVVVDDGSSDDTARVLKDFRQEHPVLGNAFGPISIQYLFHPTNQGKGAALKTGFRAAQGDVVGIQDADQEYDPREFAVLLSTILLDEADVVYGSRFAAGNRTNSPAWHRFGNRLITGFSNWMTGLNLTDAETCYKLIRKPILDSILDSLQEKRFGIELEVTAKLARIPELRIDERPISYDKRTYAQGKKIGIRDGFRALWCILKY